MAKRFTDTDKWKRGWFLDLPMVAKVSWVYILDDCDHRGVWPANFKRLSFHVDKRVERHEFELWFSGKVVPFDGDKYFIPSFIDFQYGRPLNPGNNAHKAVIALEESISFLAPHEPLTDSISSSRRAQDKDRDKEKDKDNNTSSVFDFEYIYSLYPRKEGKANGIRKCRAQIKSQADYDALEASVKAYSAKKAGTEARYLKLFSSFMENESWRDWLDPDTGSGPKAKTLHDEMAEYYRSNDVPGAGLEDSFDD